MKKHICNSEKGRKTEPCPKKVPIFQSLSDEEILKVAKMTNHIQFQKGQMLIQEGEKSDTLYIINQKARLNYRSIRQMGKSRFYIL